jgi:signal transduction histidine kinase
MRLALLDECARKAGTERSIGEIKQLVDRAMHLSRSLMLHMSHPALYEFGLVAAAEWLAEDMEELHGLKVDLSGPRESDPLDQRARVILFQCLRELLINVAKHAETDRAAVHIDWTDSSARVTVSDRGIGFDLEAARRKHDGVGFGLFSIHERIRTLGGQLEVRSSPNQGTTISITAPMDQGDSTEAERDKG